MCLVCLAIVAWFRYVVPQRFLTGEAIPIGIVSLHDPEPAIGGFCYLQLGTYFRLMHNLTSAPFLAAGVFALALTHRHLCAGVAECPRAPLALWIALASTLFTLAYMLSLFTPVIVTGVRLAMT